MIQISKYNKQHPLRVFEAFAGYGSQSLAFKYLKEKHPEFDFKVVGYSEIESSAIQAYGLLHGRDITNYGDVTRIDWNEVPDFDFISWSSPCQCIELALADDAGSRLLLAQELVYVGFVYTHQPEAVSRSVLPDLDGVFLAVGSRMNDLFVHDGYECH